MSFHHELKAGDDICYHHHSSESPIYGRITGRDGVSLTVRRFSQTREVVDMDGFHSIYYHHSELFLTDVENVTVNIIMDVIFVITSEMISSLLEGITSCFMMDIGGSGKA